MLFSRRDDVVILRNGDVKTGCQDDDVDDVTDRMRLEPCHVHVEPPMKPEVEQLTYPAELARSLDLDVAIGESGLTISGLTFEFSSLRRDTEFNNAACLFVFPHVILKLDAARITKRDIINVSWWVMNNIYLGQKVKGLRHESQNQCRHGSLHSCECWLLLVWY